MTNRETTTDRDRIAVAAMQGILSGDAGLPPEDCAARAYAQADAMLAARGEPITLVQLIERHITFCLERFGRGQRREGLVTHIRDECIEIRDAPTRIQAAEEFADPILLSLNGMVLELIGEGCPRGELAGVMAGMILDKIAENEARVWRIPDSPDAPILHIREGRP